MREGQHRISEEDEVAGRLGLLAIDAIIRSNPKYAGAVRAMMDPATRGMVDWQVEQARQ